MYDTVNHGPASCSVQLCPRWYKYTIQNLPEDVCLSEHSSWKAVWSSSGTFPEVETFHYIFDHDCWVQDFAEELPFHPCQQFSLPPLPALCLSFPVSQIGFCPYSLQLPFPLVSVPDFQPSFRLDNSHLYFSIPPVSHLFTSKAKTQMCCFLSVASSLSIWHLTLSVCCLLFLFSAHSLSSLSILLSLIYPLDKKMEFLTWIY